MKKYRHKWVSGCTIYETLKDDGSRSFVATVLGWRNWLIYKGSNSQDNIEKIIRRVRAIKQLIEHGIEKVYHIDVKISEELK